MIKITDSPNEYPTAHAYQVSERSIPWKIETFTTGAYLGKVLDLEHKMRWYALKFKSCRKHQVNETLLIS